MYNLDTEDKTQSYRVNFYKRVYCHDLMYYLSISLAKVKHLIYYYFLFFIFLKHVNLIVGVTLQVTITKAEEFAWIILG